MNEEFNVGDIVTISLETGIPRTMRIIQYPYRFTNGGYRTNLAGDVNGGFTTIIYDDRAKCGWTDNGGYHEDVFLLASLTRAANQEQ